MRQRPFRFLHAGDLHLDCPCNTAAELPDHLIDLLIEAPLQAATKLFDAALNHRVDFVLLSGDVVDPQRAAPRELLFLVNQFQRLADRNIPVYWSGGPIDSLPQWPAYIVWPSNVHRFFNGRIHHFRHEIAGALVCEIIGSNHDSSQPSRPYDFAPGAADCFSIALAHANWTATALGDIGIDYWALGGSHNSTTPLESKCVAHVAGTPQGRSIHETGPHGCTLVAVDEHSSVHLTPIDCDVVRWLTPQLLLPATANRGDLERILIERLDQLQEPPADVVLLMNWQIACHGPLRWALQHESLGAELITKLRHDFGRKQSPIWTLAVEAALPEQMPSAWYSEETLRGDFLRAVQQCTEASSFGETYQPTADPRSTPLNHLELPGSQQLVLTLPENVAELLATDNHPMISADLLAQIAPAMNSPDCRQRLIQEIAWLGADLLSPQEARP
jgi:DNA repair exonuclease SbcCD nuclease subunit